MPKKISIGTLSPEDAETADLLVCARLPDTSPFTDNLTSACTLCGHGIYFRPYVPSLPRKVCVICAPKFIPIAGKFRKS